MTRLRVRLLTVVVLGLATLRALVDVGVGSVAVPPVSSWSALDAWYAAVGPAEGAMAVVRLAAILGVAWLSLAAALQLVASLSLRQELRRAADALSPRVLQRMAHLSLTAGLALPGSHLPAEDSPGIAVMELLEDPTPAPTTTSTTVPPTVPPAAPAEPVSSLEAAPAEREVVVQPGDSLWAIAAEALSDARGQAPSAGEVDRYWRRLIAANRARLVDPSNADLLYPAQRLVLPDLDA